MNKELILILFKINVDGASQQQLAEYMANMEKCVVLMKMR